MKYSVALAMILFCGLVAAADLPLHPVGTDAATMAAGSQAMPLLHPLFSDHAVLQRNVPIVVWGWTQPGAAVRVELSSASLPQPLKAEAVGGLAGRWQVELPAQPAGGPYELTAVSGNVSASAKDLLVGEVWLCSGQSNMEMSLSGCQDGQKAVAAAQYPRLRLCKVPTDLQVDAQESVPLAWLPCSPDSARDFSGAAYYLGLKLMQELDVPVGLIESAVGGTIAESWMSLPAMLSDLRIGNPLLPRSEHHGDLDRWLAQSERIRWQSRMNHGASWEQLYRAWIAANEPGHAAKVAWYDPALDDGAWKTMKLPGEWSQKNGLPNFAGVVWFRKTVTLDAAWAAASANVAIGSPRDHDTVWINGEQVGETLLANGQNHIYPVRPGLLRPGANTIVIRLSGYDNYHSGIARVSRVNPPPSEMYLAQGERRLDLEGEWRLQPSVDFRLSPPLPVRITDKNSPAVLFNAMIAPLFPYRIKGMAWYQGEYNTWSGLYYRNTLTGLIADWRRGFMQGNLPFLIVQLPNISEINAKQPEAGNDGWVLVRESQRLVAASVPAAAMVVITDIGDPHHIHPLNKIDVGDRLARAAFELAYGRAGEWCGPLYREATVEDARVRIRFDHVGAGLRAKDGKPLAGFAIAGEDKHFVWGDAAIDGNAVVVSSAQVPHPVAVRYAWAQNPIGNLSNDTDLPASPFRTDDWPMPQQSW